MCRLFIDGKWIHTYVNAERDSRDCLDFAFCLLDPFFWQAPNEVDN